MASGKEWARETGVKTWPAEKPLNILAMQEMATGPAHGGTCAHHGSGSLGGSHFAGLEASP